MSILSDGLFHQTVADGTEGAVVREYETSDGKTGKKTELTFDTLTGMITDIFFFEGEFSNTLHIIVDDVEMSLNVASAFGEDMLKKLPNVDMSKEVVLKPFSFVDDRGKNRKGITIMQDDVKVRNYFYDEEKKEAIHGVEEIKLPKKDKKGTISSDAWKIYFAQVRQFLVEYAEEHLVTKKDEASEDGGATFEDFK